MGDGPAPWLGGTGDVPPPCESFMEAPKPKPKVVEEAKAGKGVMTPNKKKTEDKKKDEDKKDITKKKEERKESKKEEDGSPKRASSKLPEEAKKKEVKVMDEDQ